MKAIGIINVFDKHDNQLRRIELRMMSLMLEARMPDTDAGSWSEADFWRLERRTLSIPFALMMQLKRKGYVLGLSLAKGSSSKEKSGLY